MTVLEHFEIIQTQDGSPSLRLLRTNEAMHNPKGALSESCYIYKKVMDEVLALSSPDLLRPLRVLSLGLGLGYNELLLLAQSYKKNVEIYLDSYESFEPLRANFCAWLCNEKCELFDVYDEIIEMICQQDGISVAALKTFVRQKMIDKAFCLHGAFSQNEFRRSTYHGILFDAFSEKTSPELWSESFLNEFLDQCCEPVCVFATYAAKSSLTKALTRAQFCVEKIRGFGGKRQSTWARRGAVKVWSSAQPSRFEIDSKH